MYRVTIGIPAYKRPAMLRKLLLSIANNTIDSAIVKELSIVIVDNDIERTSEQVAAEFTKESSYPFKLYYHNYPVRGLSNVRNELFKKALEDKPDFIVGIDDDEFTVNDWLVQLLSSIADHKADIAIGRVIPKFESAIKPYMTHLFNYRNFANHSRLNFFASGNFIINAQFLEKNQLKFDDRFNSTGAEDSYFGIVALKKGALIIGASEAIAFETIPQKRATLNWLLKRRFRTAITYTYILILERKYLNLLKKIMVNMIYLLTGIMALVFLLFPFRHKYWGLLKIAESIGGFTGLLNLKYHEYS